MKRFTAWRVIRELLRRAALSKRMRARVRGPRAVSPQTLLLFLLLLLHPLLSHGRRQQQLLDKTVPHALLRWCATLAFALLYALRVWALGGFFIVT